MNSFPASIYFDYSLTSTISMMSALHIITLQKRKISELTKDLNILVEADIT